MGKATFIALFICFVFFVPGVYAAYLSVDNFDDQVRPNNLGGDYGIWMLSWNDPTQSCHMNYDIAEKIGSWGASVKIRYDVDSDNKAACGFFTLLRGVDLRRFDRLIFYIKGDKEEGFTTRLQVEISTPTEVDRYLITGITEKWQKKVVPLSDFKISDWSNITKFAIVIEDNIVNQKVGAIYIDDIYFSDSERAM
jgi:hypothetical protein